MRDELKLGIKYIPINLVLNQDLLDYAGIGRWLIFSARQRVALGVNLH